MESLPPEMVEKVVQHLTPQDLARCCAVSRGWREVFNQDWLWEPHCDLELEEPLCTTPSVVTPAFVVPGGEDSTLTPVGQWRLAFMREQHLWGNWKKKAFRKEYYPVSRVHRYVDKNVFLTDTLLLAWSLNSIEIWDVGSIPAVLFARSNPSVDVKRWHSCNVVGGRMLILRQKDSIQVFLVDRVKKCIDLKHEIPLGLIMQYNQQSWVYELGDLFLIRDSVDSTVVFGVTASESNEGLVIYNLEKGEKIKEDHIPVIGNQYSHIFGIKTSPLSEDILVLVLSRGEKVTYIYSPKQLRYLVGPISVGRIIDLNDCAINKHYIALGDVPFLVIVDYLTSEVVLKYEGLKDFKLRPQAYNDSFIFLDFRDGKGIIQMFSLANKTITSIFEYVTNQSLGDVNGYLSQVVNNRFVILYEIDSVVVAECTLQFSGQSLKPIDILFSKPYYKLNKSFTRGNNFDGKGSLIYYYW